MRVPKKYMFNIWDKVQYIERMQNKNTIFKVIELLENDCITIKPLNNLDFEEDFYDDCMEDFKLV